MVGYVVTRRGLYWTGAPPPNDLTADPSQALVDVWPWDAAGRKTMPYHEGRCYRVLLRDEATMLPLAQWPTPEGLPGEHAADPGAVPHVQALRGARVGVRFNEERDPAHHPGQPRNPAK